MRGVAFLTAVTFVAEIADVRRFQTPRQLMAYLGLVPSERSTGEQVRRGSITKAGNPRARRVLIEGAWTYRYPARLKPAFTAATGELVQGRKGNSLESPGAAVCALSQVNGSGKAPDLNHDGDRT